MYPTIEQVEAASHEQLARWYRFLPSPVAVQENVEVLSRIAERLEKLGGFTPEISKKIGW